jgi:hypothetical protein
MKKGCGGGNANSWGENDSFEQKLIYFLRQSLIPLFDLRFKGSGYVWSLPWTIYLPLFLLLKMVMVKYTGVPCGISKCNLKHSTANL